ncbi:MAG: VPS10 domain-containing protein [Acidobacteriota bacterium]
MGLSTRVSLASLAVAAAVLLSPPLGAQENPKTDPAAAFDGLALRPLGPALMSGRIGDFAVDPQRPERRFVAVASGGVWLTENGGTTWTPVFDAEGSYSIGCVTLDPKNPFVVWVGTGENNSQRSVGYGDGVYRSEDSGRSWKNVGLKASEHIAKILVDPRDSNTVYAAAQGPLWARGGDRGLYKTTDGGKTWRQVLKISDDTGVTDVVMDPRDPDVLLAASYQRRRHVWGLVNGGPEAAIHKSTDGGETWRKVSQGLPKADLGRVGLAISPADPDVVYAIVEAALEEGGFFRSKDRGETWVKQSDIQTSSGQYYNEIIADPKDPDRVYLMDTWMKVTEDGGKTFRKVGERFKHVDNHALWIDPRDTDHLLAGCDGGIYESFDRGATWKFTDNLPVTQFYRVTPDNARPFYNVYGGTQDNNTLGGPSRTTTTHGITNADWVVTVGGDGFKTQVDPDNPDIVYSQSQYGGLIRWDRRTGEILDIQPQPAPGGDPLRFNWDSPLLVSPHDPARLYFAAQMVFRSDDRGSSWRAVSPDLSRRIDRNTLPMMGRVWGVDAVAKNASTSFYGNVVSLNESPLLEGLLYAGTDDGLIQVTEDGGGAWRAVATFPGVPERAYVSDLEASRHEPDVVYAAFDNHKEGDFKPYLLKSSDRGRTWASVAGDLPARGTVYAVAEDHVEKDLLFAGTEFGLFFSRDGGKKWIRLKGGLPTIAVRDLEIQRREDDLVVATFGRGLYILDDYSPLREATAEALQRPAALYPVKKAWLYVPSSPLGLPEKASLGDGFFTAPNPPFGAVFTYRLKEEIRSLKKQRQEAEKKALEEKRAVPYPTWDALRAEDREEAPAVLLVVSDADGNPVRTLTGPVTAGFHRVAWDLRFPPSDPVRLQVPEDFNPWAPVPMGPLAAPGTYRVQLFSRAGGTVKALSEPRSFTVEPLWSGELSQAQRAETLAFGRKTQRLQRAVLGSDAFLDELKVRLAHLARAVDDSPSAPPEAALDVRRLEGRLQDLAVRLRGDATVRRRNEPDPPSILERVQQVVGGHFGTTSQPTGTHEDAVRAASAAFGPFLSDLRRLAQDVSAFEARMEGLGAPWTPGRVPDWKEE